MGRQYHGRRKCYGASESFQLEEQSTGRLFMGTREYIKTINQVAWIEARQFDPWKLESWSWSN